MVERPRRADSLVVAVGRQVAGFLPGTARRLRRSVRARSNACCGPGAFGSRAATDAVFAPRICRFRAFRRTGMVVAAGLVGDGTLRESFPCALPASLCLRCLCPADNAGASAAAARGQPGTLVWPAPVAREIPSPWSA